MNKKTIEEEFDKKFTRTHAETGEYKDEWFIKDWTEAREIKSFLSKTIEDVVEKVLGKEKTRPKESFADKNLGNEYELWKKGYNQKHQEIIDKFREMGYLK